MRHSVGVIVWAAILVAVTPLGAAAAAGGLAQAPAGKPDLTGEWRLNVKKSDFGHLPAPKGRTDKIEHQDPNLKIVRTTRTPQGDATGELDCTTDGKECKVTLSGAQLQLTTSVVWDASVLVFESKGTFEGTDVLIRERWTLSGDGKSVTIRRHVESGGDQADQSLLLEKQ